MTTLQTLNSTEILRTVSLEKINDNFDALNSGKAEVTALASKQDTLVSWTNIKTINGNAITGSGNLSIPVLTDWDKGDITLTSSATVWTIDNGVVTLQKLANINSMEFLARIWWWIWQVQAVTHTQVATMLPTATTSLAGTMSAIDKTKLDWLSNEWSLITSWTLTASATYNSDTLTTYDEYRVDIVATSTSWASTTIWMRYNSDSTSSSYSSNTLSTSTSTSSSNDSQFNILAHTQWSGARFTAKYIIDRASGAIRWEYSHPFIAGSTSATWLVMWNKQLAPTSIQLIMWTISGTIKIYWRNY